VGDQRRGLREQKRLDTWHAIRAAAFELMLARGFDDVAVEEVAAVARVSRTTLFNYFGSKEALVLDVSPEEPYRWRALFAARPDGEAIWTSVRAVMIGYLAEKGEHLGVEKRLKAMSPRLVASARDVSHQMAEELRSWIAQRLGESPGSFTVSLVLNCAVAIVSTAYARWEVSDGVPAFLNLVEQGFDRITVQT
jgi:AcrR family transcriptional regulator